MKAIYTAVLSPCEDGYRASVPDLPGCISSGRTLADAVDEITDAMSVWLCAQEDIGKTIPEATPQNSVHHSADDICTLIQCDTIQYRAETDTKAVRKNVSLPAWMVSLADKRGINCSQILQDALRAKLETT